MTKEKSEQAAPAPAQGNFDVTLDEFCAFKSGSGTGPELLAGFHHWQKANGVTKGSSAAFERALSDFCNLPA